MNATGRDFFGNGITGGFGRTGSGETEPTVPEAVRIVFTDRPACRPMMPTATGRSGAGTTGGGVEGATVEPIVFMLISRDALTLRVVGPGPYGVRSAGPGFLRF
jgi:hypothetical protein